jgi:hypothetical protein
MKLKFDYPISNFDIINFCKKYNIKLNGVIMLDEFNNLTKYGSYVVNLDKTDGNGTHWVAIYYKPEYILYFDSYGVYPPKEIIDNAKSKNLYYSNFIIQNEKSVLCGWFCLGYLFFIQNSKIKPIKKRFNEFTKLFYNNEEINDSVVISYINEIVDKNNI